MKVYWSFLGSKPLPTLVYYDVIKNAEPEKYVKNFWQQEPTSFGKIDYNVEN